MSSNISKVGITNNSSTSHSAPAMQDNSGTGKVASGGANINKVVPGMNGSIVPLIADPKR